MKAVSKVSVRGCAIVFRGYCFVMLLGSLLVQCNPDPPRRPAQRPGATVPPPVAAAPSPEPEPREQPPPGPQVNPEAPPAPQGSDAQGSLGVGGAAPGAGSVGGGSKQDPAPAPPGGDNGSGGGGMNGGGGAVPPSGTGGVGFAIVPFFKSASTAVGSRQGSWNRSCVSVLDASGARLGGALCNKKLSSGCYVIDSQSRGLPRDLGAASISGALSIKYDVTDGAQFCNGTDETGGFTYSANVAESFLSSTASSPVRFKCGKKQESGKFLYKVCLEDNLLDASKFASAWDFNDFVLIFQSDKELTFSGLTCDANAFMSLPDDRCS